MAELDTSSGGGGKHKGKKRGKKLSTRIDMTPMVDLAFLLVTFFMLATTLSKPSIMPLMLPKEEKPDPNTPPNQVADSKAFTIILGKDNKIYYYRGGFTKDKKPTIETTTYGADKFRKIMLQKKAEITNDVVASLKRQDPVVIIKPTDKSVFRNFVDMMDEMRVCEIKRYVKVEMQPEDYTNLKDQGIDP